MAGATCSDGSQFIGNAIGSVWEITSENGGVFYRISECPPGHSLERSSVPINDNCLPCEYGKYRFDKSLLNSTRPHCLTCHAKATCKGRDVVEANEGDLLTSNVVCDTAQKYCENVQVLSTSEEKLVVFPPMELL